MLRWKEPNTIRQEHYLTDNVLTALISAAGMALTAITALILNYRGFNSIERRLEIIEKDLKDFFRELSGHDKRISTLENKP